MSNKARKLITLSLSLFLIFRSATPVRGVEVVISGNGSGSSSEVTITQETQTTIEQSNSANVENNVNSSANTGGSIASGNTVADTTIVSGNVTSDIQVQNSLNNSSVQTQCCEGGDSQITVSGNGANSQNTVNFSQDLNSSVAVNQVANIENSVGVDANTGRNSVSNTTGGNVTITTGNINASGAVFNDPVDQSSISLALAGVGVSVTVSENGAESKNAISLDLENASNTFSNFEANIENYLVWDLDTGGNEVKATTGGEVAITTGDIDFNLILENLANIGEANIECCPTRVNSPGEEEEEPPEPPGEAQPAPAVGDGGGGKLLPSAAAIEAGGPGIIGLSDTSSASARALFFMIGLVMIAFGGKIIVEELLPAASKRR